MAAWYAPQRDYALTAQYKKPPAEMAVTTSLLLVVADKGQEVLGGLAFLPQVERRFSFDVSAPEGWQVVSVTAADGKPLPFEHYAGDGMLTSTRLAPASTPGATAASRIRVTVPGGMAVGQEYKANFRALRTPKGWLDEWKSAPVEFPKFAVLGTTHDVGAVAVDVRDDLSVRPEKLVQLVPLDAGDKPKYGLAGVSTRLAYRYDSPKYAASLLVERIRPRLTARTFSFIRVEPSALDCHYEVVYRVQRPARRSLPSCCRRRRRRRFRSRRSTARRSRNRIPRSSASSGDGPYRWPSLRPERVRLAVAFQQPLPGDATAAENVAGSKPQHVTDAICRVAPDIISAVCRCHFPMPTAGVAGHRGLRRGLSVGPGGGRGLCRVGGEGPYAGAASRRGRTGQRRVCARPAVAGGLRVRRRSAGGDDRRLASPGLRPLSGNRPGMRARHKPLARRPKPDANAVQVANKGAVPASEIAGKGRAMVGRVRRDAAEAATAERQPLDRRAGRPHRCSADAANRLRGEGRAGGVRGTVAVPAPKLLLRAEGKGTAVEVPLVDLVWRLHLPSGYDVVGTGGTVATDELKPPPPAAVEVARFLFGWNAGLSHFGLLGSAQYARVCKTRDRQQQSEADWSRFAQLWSGQ